MKFKKSWFYWWGHGIDSVMEYRLIVMPGFIDKPKKRYGCGLLFIILYINSKFLKNEVGFHLRV